MYTQGGLVGVKQEMTRVWHEGKQIPVTLIKVLDQKVIQHKTVEKDGYTALVVGVQQKPTNKKKGQKVAYTMVTEYRVQEEVLAQYPIETVLSADMFADISSVRVRARSKGKGFQGVMKRHNFAGGPETHGSKFHRAGGSTGNRNPKRTIRGWKMAGHMGDDVVTLRSVPVVDIWNHEDETYVVMKGSIPGSYNGCVHLMSI